MALSRLKALAASPAVRKFTDRDSARGAFAKALSAYLSREQSFRVLTYYGVGGIGKTSLLGALGNAARAEADARGITLCTVRLDFDSDHLGSAAEAQYAFRMQWPGPCPLFEFALARYWVAQGRSLDQIKRQVIRQDSLLFDLVEASAGLADLFVPVKLVGRLLSLGSDTVRRYGHLRSAFERIAELPEADLAEHLPLLLGQAIEEWAKESGNHLLVLIDGHERLFTDERYKLGKLRGDDWLRELVGAAETGLYVFCGRNYLAWGKQNPEWDDYLEQHVLGRLSDEDAAEFLRGIPVTEHDIRRTIVAEARGVPLYLDICASIYLIKKDAGEPVRREDFGNVDGEVIGRFMNCLDRDQAEAVRALSALACFDRAVFATVTRALNIGLPASLFDEFCCASYVEFTGPAQAVAKIHAIIRERLQPQVALQDRQRIVQALLDDAGQARAAGDYRQVALLLRSLMPALTWRGLALPPSAWSALGTLCLGLADGGFVDEAMSLGTALAGTTEGSEARAVGEVTRAHCLRQRGELAEARIAYRTCDVANARSPGLRELQLRVRYHAAHVDHLLGHYASAAERYGEIFHSPAQGPADEAARWLARRQHGDILMLKGLFPEALDAFTECSRQQPDDRLWQLECQRFQGHVYRFNWMLDAALAQYERVAEGATAHGILGMQGKALVNIAETCAWTDPDRSIQTGRQAIEITDSLNNAIETGKAWTAVGVAQVCRGEYEEAGRSIAEALAIQRRVGYRSGELFALGASACLARASGDMASTVALLHEMHAIRDGIDVYPYVAWFHQGVCGDVALPAEGVATWLAGAQVEAGVERARTLLAPRTGG